MKTVICSIVTIVLTITLSLPSWAQSNPCLTDYRKHCSGVIPGGGRIIQCLNRKVDSLTPNCRVSVQGLLACKSDQKKYCDGVRPKNWKLQKCMEKHLTSLTPSCAKTVNYMKKIRKG